MKLRWKIVFAGDVYIKNGNLSQIVSEELKIFLYTHELRSCNFEAPLVSKTSSKTPKVGSYLSHSNNSSVLVKEAGFNVINLANNHIYDYGDEGLLLTLDSFKDVLTVGAGADFNEAYKLKVHIIGQIRIGFLSFCEAEFGYLKDNNEKRAGYAWINNYNVNKMIFESKKEVDLLFVQIHAGVEEIDIPLPEWRDRYKEIIDAGADLIIGHHPHVPHGWEKYNDKMIFYSLGNFFFDFKSNNKDLYKSFVVSFEYENATMIDYKIIPVTCMRELTDLNKDRSYYNYLLSLSQKLEKKDIYLNEINRISVELWNTRYKNYYAQALNGLTENVKSLKLIKNIIRRLVISRSIQDRYLLLLHNIRIESHRWIVQRALSLLFEKNYKI